MGRVRRNGDQQRAPSPASAPRARAACGRARRCRDHLRDRSPARLPTSGSLPPSRYGTNAAAFSPMHAGMKYARLDELGGIQWPCPDESHPGTQFLHARLWQDPVEGPRAPFSVVEHDPPVDTLTDEFPIRLTTGRPSRLFQHRSPDRRVHLAAAPTRGAAAFARRRPPGWASRMASASWPAPGVGRSRCR